MLENLKTRILAMVLLYIVCKLTEKLNLNDFSAANTEIFAKKSLLFWFLFCFYLFIYFWSGGGGVCPAYPVDRCSCSVRNKS